MNDNISVTGLVATDPRLIVTSEGLAIATFRVASAQRRFVKAQERWVDAETNWYTVTTFRQLAHNVAASFKKGERVVVTGKLRIREWDTGERNGTTIEIDADGVGHDLLWGTSTFVRNVVTQSAPDHEAPPAVDQGEPDAVSAPEPHSEVQGLAQQQLQPEPAVPF